MPSCFVAHWAQTTPGAPAIRTGTASITYRELDRLVEAERLALDARPGTRVEVDGRDPLKALVQFHALGRAGAVYLALHPSIKDAERQAYRETFVGLPVRAGTRVALCTSGTSGRPKPIELTEANFLAATAANAANLGQSPDARWLLTLPLFHIGGLATVYRCAHAGACIVLEPRFDAERVAAHFDRGVTHASLVPTMVVRLLRLAAHYRGLAAILVGGGPLTPELAAEARERGLPVLQTYGLTEATSQVATERLREADGTTCGPPLPSVQVRLVDSEGRPVPQGQDGDIEVSGPTVFREGWYPTGDIGSFDARGRLLVRARRVDLILRGGENVYPSELETLLLAHPSVAEVAIVPAVDREWGQVPVGFVVFRGEPTDLEGWLAERVASYKVPRQWFSLPELPRNALGKVLRNELRQKVAAVHDAAKTTR